MPIHRSAIPSSILFLSALAPAQDLPRAAVDVARGVASVLVDRDVDGAVLALAPRYKARLAKDGIEVIPYFGPKAPRNFPVRIRVRSVVAGGRALELGPAGEPRLDGTRVTIPRGDVLEVWDLGVAAAEQSFVVPGPIAVGEIRVALEVTTELVRRDVEDGLVFEHPTLGALHYGDGLAFDEGGRRVPIESRFGSDGIELVVPADFVGDARGAITIDPLVTSVAIDGGSDDVFDPDVAYEPVTDRFLVVYERRFSATDSDVIARRFTGAGVLLEELAVATGTRESHRPAVGANSTARKFLIAWDEDAGVADRVVRCRTRDAGGTTQGAPITAIDSAGVTIGDENPSVGGGTGDRFVIVAEQVNSLGTSSALIAARVGTNSTLLGTTSLDNATNETLRRPFVTRANANGQWGCVFVVASNGSASTRVRTILVPSANQASLPSVTVFQDDGFDTCGLAGDGTDYMLVAGRSAIGLVVSAHLRPFNGRLLVQDTHGIGAIEHAGGPVPQKRSPVIAFDGARHAYAYHEFVGQGFDVFAAAFSIRSPGLFFSDTHAPLHAASSTAGELSPAIAAPGEMGGDPGRHFVAWTRVNANGDRDVMGAIYGGTTPGGGVTVLDTHCGSVSFGLIAENPPVLGATLRLRATSIVPPSQLMLIGGATTPIALCSRGCELGVSPLFFVLNGAAADLPIPSSTSILGATIAAQNVLLLNLGGCTTAEFAVALIVSDTLVITVQ